MSRLLFAAARGARIEYPNTDGIGWRQFLNNVPISRNEDCRIHPDDAHLQYGPISSALREQAKAHPKIDTYGPYNSCAITAWATDADFVLPTEQRDIPLFLLILAEALADEGL